MSLLLGKKILLGISGGIAAYKCAHLVRAFIKKGAQVKVVMTEAAKDFITPLTLSTLSKHPVLSTFTNQEDDNELWNNHVDLGLWADYFVIAPATANTLSKMAHGQCDNLLIATYLSAKCPVFVAPAMDLDMYKHPSTTTSLDLLKANKNSIIPAASGELASGLVGQGRMAEPEAIVNHVVSYIKNSLPLNGKKVLVTAGPTYEAIDPVRFIGNHSSGKMGFAIASAAAHLGASVILISGPTALSVTHHAIDIHNVTSAEEMYHKCHQFFSDVDIAIMSSAVADYRPKNVATSKIKKSETTFTIELEKTKDILKSLGDIKTHQYLVGFALETDNELEHAKNKLAQKNLNLIVLNSLNDEGTGFGFSTNKVTFITNNGEVLAQDLKSKTQVAQDLFKLILEQHDVS